MTEDRLNKLEDSVHYIRAKIDNGLSERTKKNSEHLEQLVEKQNQFEINFYKHMINTQSVYEKTDKSIDNIRGHMETLADTQNKWTIIVQRFVIGLLSVLFGLVFWVVVNSDQISHFIDHFNDVGSGKYVVTERQHGP